MSSSFLNCVSKNFDKIKTRFTKQIIGNNLAFDEDVFSDTILKCNEKISGSSFSENEMITYLWFAFKRNTLRELKYMRNKTTDEIPEIISEEVYDPCEEFNEISKMIIKKFGPELYQLFTYHVNGGSYTELSEMTNIKNLKYQFRLIRDYVRSKYKKV